MLAYLNERLKKQNKQWQTIWRCCYTYAWKLWSTATHSGIILIPHQAIQILQQKYQQKYNIFYTKLSKQQTVKLHSILCQRGVEQFKTAGHLNYRLNINVPMIQDTWQILKRWIQVFLWLHQILNFIKHFHSLISMTWIICYFVILFSQDIIYVKNLMHSLLIFGCNISKLALFDEKKQIKYNTLSGMPHTDEQILHAEK